MVTPDQVHAMAGFLDAVDFKYFCTFTTRKPVSLGATRRIAEKVAHYIDAGRTSTMFWAAEPFDVREGYHFHALMRTPYNSMDIFAWYFPRYGRCQIIDNQDPDRRQSASYYCSKYLTKGLADYDLYFDAGIQTRPQPGQLLTVPRANAIQIPLELHRKA